MVALCSGYFKLYSDASSITPCHLVIEVDALKGMCVWYPLRYLQIEKGRILRGNAFVSNSLTGGKCFTETFQTLQQTNGEDCLSRTQCHEWYQRILLFKSFALGVRISQTLVNLQIYIYF